ncbi:MAG TPA: DUF4810 domain-containing protein [Planctomycetota bacterium]
MKHLSVLIALALAGAGCGTPSYYAWGRYEASVFAVTGTPDGFDLGAEIDSLEQQVQATIDAQRPIPPGLHAHLGYLHSVAGNPAAARQHFEQEKALFPESARFMDHLLARLGAQA